MSLSGFGMRVMLTSENLQKIGHLSIIMWQFWKSDISLSPVKLFLIVVIYMLSGFSELIF